VRGTGLDTASSCRPRSYSSTGAALCSECCLLYGRWIRPEPWSTEGSRRSELINEAGERTRRPYVWCQPGHALGRVGVGNRITLLMSNCFGCKGLLFPNRRTWIVRRAGIKPLPTHSSVIRHGGRVVNFVATTGHINIIIDCATAAADAIVERLDT
jgi:hypothetical protein